MRCPRPDVLADLAKGALAETDADALAEHVAQCGGCKRHLARLDADQATVATDAPLNTPLVPGDGPSTATLEIGEKLGRYRIVGHLGSGGMGVVYAAYDPTLDRKVALKLLHPRLSRSSGHRLQREAKALAKLNHPNVVTLYELGLVDGRLFLAMELVDGSSLRDWLDTPRRPSEVVDVMRGAGAGLAAAHEAGLIHRDFKPDNVLIGLDGRPRVTDFGLVRAAEDESSTGSEPRAPSGRGGELQTEHGLVLGTPAYMPPEQYQGQCDALSDQYAYCVTFFEALFGTRPFAGRDARSLQAAIIKGKPIDPPSSKAPRWLVDIVLRGMAKRPENRFPSMYALLDELDIRPRRRRQLRHAAAFVVVGGVIAASAYASASAGRRHCDDTAALQGVWDDAVQNRLAQHFDTGNRGLGRAGWNALQSQIDQHAQAWLEVWREQCEAPQGGSMAGGGDLVAACLADRRRELVALTEALATAEPVVLEHPAVLMGALRSPHLCADTSSLAAIASRPTDPGADAILDDGSSMLARARTMAAAGEYVEAIEVAMQAHAGAEKLGWPPLTADTQATLAELLEGAGKTTEAVQAWRAAATAAERARDERRAAAAWVGIANAEGFELGHHEAADHALQMAQAKIDRGDLGDDVRADLESARAAAMLARGEIQAALAAQQRAYALLQNAPWATALERALTLSRVAAIHHQAGNLDESKQLGMQALQEATAALGEDHPSLATILGNLANAAYAKGDLEEARDALARALELFEASVVPDAPLIAKALSNLSTIEHAMGNKERAMELALRALAIEEEILGPEHLQTAQTLDKVGTGYTDRGDFGAAIAAHERALAIRRKQLDEDHPWMAYSLIPLGQAKMALGQHDEAVALFERAFEIREKASSEAGERGEAAFELAQAMMAAGQDRQKAIDYARKARDFFAKAKMPGVSDVEAWLADHE